MVLFGTEGTKNQLNDDLPGSYKHVTVLKPLDVADIDICNDLSMLKPSKGRIAGDFLDGLLVSCDMMERKLGRTKYDKRYSVSNFVFCTKICRVVYNYHLDEQGLTNALHLHI